MPNNRIKADAEKRSGARRQGRIGGAAYAKCYINSKEIGASTYGKYIFFIAGWIRA